MSEFTGLVPVEVDRQSKKLFERSKKVSPGGVHSPVRAFKNIGTTPRFILNAKGSKMSDADGVRYTDFCMSWGPLIFGHQDPEISEAVQSAIKKGWSFGTAEPYSLELAETITSEIDWVDQIRFVNSGTEAVMSALRLARAATGRSKTLKFDGCYHGHVDSMLVRAGSGLADMAEPDSAGISKATAAETIVAPLDDEAALETIFNEHGSDIAVVALEPLPANNGLLPQRESFLKKISELCKKHGSLLLFDEVISGFRVAFGGMAEKTGIRPDLVCYGKVIGGGFPVGAYGGRRDLMEQIAPSGPVYQAGTLSANPVSMVAGLSTIQKLLRDKPYTELENRTALLKRKLEEVAQKHSKEPFQIQISSSIFWMVHGKPKSDVNLVRAPSQIPEEQKEKYAKTYIEFLKRGYYFAPSGFEVGFMATVHTDEDIEHLASTLEQIYKEA